MKFAELAEVMAGAESGGNVPSPGLMVPESVGSACTWNAWEKKCGAVMPVSLVPLSLISRTHSLAEPSPQVAPAPPLPSPIKGSGSAKTWYGRSELGELR